VGVDGVGQYARGGAQRFDVVGEVPLQMIRDDDCDGHNARSQAQPRARGLAQLPHDPNDLPIPHTPLGIETIRSTAAETLGKPQVGGGLWALRRRGV
jgi:hypothetical protein